MPAFVTYDAKKFSRAIRRLGRVVIDVCIFSFDLACACLGQCLARGEIELPAAASQGRTLAVETLPPGLLISWQHCGKDDET